tara:strand:+ start:4625 stop:4777 length:153 start_codon:yes stop_codon:yes gene_type:complete
MTHQIDAVTEELKDLRERNRILALKLAQYMPGDVNAGMAGPNTEAEDDRT